MLVRNHFCNETFKHILKLKGVMQKGEKHQPVSMNTVESMNTKTGQVRECTEKKTIQTDRNTVASRWV